MPRWKASAFLVILTLMLAGCAAPGNAQDSRVSALEDAAAGAAGGDEAALENNASLEVIERTFAGTWRWAVTGPEGGPSGVRTPPSDFRTPPKTLTANATITWGSDLNTGDVTVALRNENGAVLWSEDAASSPVTFELPVDAARRASRITAYPSGPGAGVNVDFEIRVLFTVEVAEPGA